MHIYSKEAYIHKIALQKRPTDMNSKETNECGVSIMGIDLFVDIYVYIFKKDLHT